jgi:hypothetical protein
MHKQVLQHSLQTISWLGDRVVDWASAGESYSVSGDKVQLQQYHFGFNFDSAIHHEDGQYVFIYQKLGTKGLLIKDGEILREINRSYYHSNVYEYPAAFFTDNGKAYLAHCPISYCQLDFEDVETGELVTNIAGRKPADIFHSRLEISSSGKSLMSKGWVWHPIDVINVYSIEDCFTNPLLLDKLDFGYPDPGSEICTASFIDDTKILVGSSAEILDEEHLLNLSAKSFGIWNFKENSFSQCTTPAFEFGNLFAIDDTLCWDVYMFPKIINLHTGKIVDKDETVFTGKQKSSILFNMEQQPQIAFDAKRNRLAIKENDTVIILTR